jgi:hypothetical protein
MHDPATSGEKSELPAVMVLKWYSNNEENGLLSSSPYM